MDLVGWKEYLKVFVVDDNGDDDAIECFRGVMSFLAANGVCS